jgi:predicted aldo/keto reductase-like oxidoreductase
MRLPTLDGARMSPNIDEAQAIAMLHRAIEAGVNYIDTAYPYHGGRSKLVVGKALAGGWRERVRLATKLPVWLVNEPGDVDRLLDEQLRKLQTSHIDFYLLHALNTERWREIVLKRGILERAAAALADGRIRHLGFSMHDNTACLEEIITGSDLWTFCQIQYNYMDIENQAGMRGLHFAAEHGLAVVVMEPLLGGRLVDPPAAVRAPMDRFPLARTPAEWALQWVWDQPQVSVVLSGMSTMEQVEENLRAASRSRVGSFTPAEQEVIGAVREGYRARTAIPCTKCSYCMPCPNGVNIPENFDIFNYAHLYDGLEDARMRYQRFLPEPEHSSHCVACQDCEPKCPQKIEISEWMPKVTQLLAG